MTDPQVLVLGGGPAGILAAAEAAARGCRVRLVEGNPRLGAKLAITGGGRCNLTHDGDLPALLAAFPRVQARFLKAAFHAFGGVDLRMWAAERGFPTILEADGRVFLAGGSGAAARLSHALEAWLRDSGVALSLGIRAAGLDADASRMRTLRMAGSGACAAAAFILATGGATWPRTGSRGEVLAWLQGLGIPVRPWRAALAPIPLRRPRPDWEGRALRGGRLCLKEGPKGRLLAAAPGDLLFTRTGISGPATLALSEATEAARLRGQLWLAYSCDPRDPAGLARELADCALAHPERGMRTWLKSWMPERLAADLLAGEGLTPGARLSGLSRDLRQRLAGWVAAFPLGEPGPVDPALGEVSAGGVALEAVDPRSMRVRGWDNLFVCGELLDIHGPVGGYNLQAAFSTGRLAGASAAALCGAGR